MINFIALSFNFVLLAILSILGLCLLVILFSAFRYAIYYMRYRKSLEHESDLWLDTLMFIVMIAFASLATYRLYIDHIIIRFIHRPIFALLLLCAFIIVSCILLYSVFHAVYGYIGTINDYCNQQRKR